jgi:ubiquinone/menaquinone biosynthesis C-methylase UbiE
MQNQKKHWNELHNKGNIDHYSNSPTKFAEEVLKIVKPSSGVLELGCGTGNDSIAFANAGHFILATDFSEVAIAKNSERFSDIPNLTFKVLDISQPIKLEDNQFDIVYARLSLHYFTDKITKKAFQEIHRVLKQDGFLCYICKSIKDPLYGTGKQIEDDMFEYKGHIRHFFSEKYATECLGDNFKVEKIESGEDNFYDRKSAFVKVIARAIK